MPVPKCPVQMPGARYGQDSGFAPPPRPAHHPSTRQSPEPGERFGPVNSAGVVAVLRSLDCSLPISSCPQRTCLGSLLFRGGGAQAKIAIQLIVVAERSHRSFHLHKHILSSFFPLFLNCKPFAVAI